MCCILCGQLSTLRVCDLCLNHGIKAGDLNVLISDGKALPVPLIDTEMPNHDLLNVLALYGDGETVFVRVIPHPSLPENEIIETLVALRRQLKVIIQRMREELTV